MLSKKPVALFLMLVLALMGIQIFSLPSHSQEKVKAYGDIYFGITRAKLAKAMTKDQKIQPNSPKEPNDWTTEYAFTDFSVYLGDAKYELIGNFYGNKEDPNGGMGDGGFVPGKLMRLWFRSQLENYFNIDLVLSRRGYLVQLISEQYGDPGKKQKVDPATLGDYETKFSHVWYEKQTGTKKRIKIGVKCTGTYYLAVMSIEHPELAAKRKEAEREKEKEETESEAQDF